MRLVLLLILIAGCATPAPSPRIGVDLSDVNEQGLRGPADGLRAVDYEYCVPADDAHVAQARAIDPTSRPMKGSKGRIGCRDDQWLLVGNTHQTGYREVLQKLATQPWIERIEPAWFE